MSNSYVNDDYPQRDITEPLETQHYQVPTEIVELPSGGILYPADHPLASGKVEMRYMTAKDEDILTTPSLIKQGVVLDRLFQSLLVTKFPYGDLLLGDKNAIMIAARVLGYGKSYQVEVQTPSGNKQQVDIDLTTLRNKPVDTSKWERGVNLFEYELPASKRPVTFRLMTQADDNAVRAQLKQLSRVNKQSGISNEATTRLLQQIVSIDGNEDRNYIRQTVLKTMLAQDARALREYMDSVTPDIDTMVELEDEETLEPFRIAMPIDVGFFWPGAK